MKKFRLIGVGMVFVLAWGSIPLVQAQSHRHPQTLVEFNSQELMEQELKTEAQTKNLEPHEFLVPRPEKEQKPIHQRWPVRLLRAATESVFLSSGLTRFSGKNLSIPPTLGSHPEP